MRTAASASVSVFPSTNWDKSARYFTPQRSRSLILARRFGKYEIRVELRNVPRYEYILAAGPAALYEIPSVSYVLPDVQEFIQIQGPSCSRQLSKWRVWNVDHHKYRVLRGRSDRNCGWWWIYAGWRGEQESDATADTPGGDTRSGPRSNLQILSCKLISKVSLFIELFCLWPGC